MIDHANPGAPPPRGLVWRGEELEKDGMEFKSLVTVESRLMFIDLQGLLDLARFEAWGHPLGSHCGLCW